MKPQKYHESKQRGSLDFPLEYHYLDENHARYQMPYHWHEEHELLRVRTGTFDLVLDGKAIPLHAGDVAFIPAEALHGGEAHGCVYECIVFDMRLLLTCNDHCKQQISDVRHHRIVLQPHFPCDHPVIRHTIPPMFDALRNQCPGWELITLGCLFQFLGEVYKFQAYATADASHWDGKRVLTLKKVFELIEADYASPLTLHDLAGAVHLSPKYFCRFFREAVHRSPIDYLNYYRIEVACNDIAFSDKTLTEVALDCGFSNLNYFIRQFRKYKGMTPGQYQALIRPQN
ncbi:MAG: helix-turn-helix domain-containing protein [Aristaeellaceae bacterium]